MSQTIRVVIVDDSALMRRVLAELLTRDPAISVVSAASNGQEAIELVQATRPDVVIMDVRMPVMDGLAATEHVMAFCPTPILVLTASLARYEVDITFKMLEAGALEVIEKPSVSDARALESVAHDLVQRVKVLSRVRVVTHLRGRRKQQIAARPNAADVQTAAPAAVPSADPWAFPVVIIGASTGGPRVIYQILAALPADFQAAIVVVQHIAPGFSAGMATWLATGCRMPVGVATDGALIRPGEVLVAPDQCNVLVRHTGRVRLCKERTHLQHPSVDVTMCAAAETFGGRTIGVLLTGMGRDGAEGMRAIKQAGGMTLAQDEASSTIFGMPRAAKEIGAVEELLPPGEIAARLIALVQERSRSVTA